MAQVNFNMMISVDWLQVSLRSFDLLSMPADNSRFSFLQRSYGTKQYRNVFDVSLIKEDGLLEPFGTFSTIPTLDSWDAQTCSLKLDNHLLYSSNRGIWIEHFRNFLDDYKLSINTFTRVDIAGDFIYLRNRVSGPQLCNHIKNLKWWKCGSVNISEHYKMPYSLEWSRSISSDGIDTEVYLQGNQMSARIETMTFGTMSSDAQVCIYDKTLELNRTAVSVLKNGAECKESAKEYIRDCHKLAGVYDEKKHTWRIEIRLKNKAAFLWDELRFMERSIMLEDLSPTHLADTFVAACDKYFRLVDATADGTIEITPEYCRKMRGHKNRLQKVNLFTPRLLRCAFVKREYHKPANQFHRSVITRLDNLADRAARIPCKETLKGDADIIPSLIDRLQPLSQTMKQDKSLMLRAINTLSQLQSKIVERDNPIDNITSGLIQQTKELIERHCNTESPVFIYNMISTLRKCEGGMTSLLSKGASHKAHAVRSAHPSDAEVLSNAADILRGIYTNVVHDERKQQTTDLYKTKLIECVNLINQTDIPSPQVLDYTYRCFASNKYVDEVYLRNLLEKQQFSPFGDLIHCNFDVDVWCKVRGLQRYSIEWTPPLLPVGEYRTGYSARDCIAAIYNDYTKYNISPLLNLM